MGRLTALLRRSSSGRRTHAPNPADIDRFMPAADAIGSAWQLGAQIGPLMEESAPTATLLSGDQLARRLGQGLDFEQLRVYQPGEPSSLIDWRISARAHEPMVRVYREPAQRQCHLIIDTSASMHFGTRQQLKITQAITVSHLLAAAALRQAMSVALHTPALPQRPSDAPSTGRTTLMHRLSTLAEWAAIGEANREADGDWAGFRQRLLRCLPDGQVIVVISDFLTEPGNEHGPLVWLPLAQHHRVLFVQIADPVERALPDVGSVVFAGNPPRRIDTHRSAERERLARLFEERRITLEDTARALGGWHALLFTDQAVPDLARQIAGAQRGQAATEPVASDRNDRNRTSP